MEHSSISVEDVAPIATAAKHAGIVPVAGPSGIADFLVSRPLDNGAMGVIVPQSPAARRRSWSCVRRCMRLTARADC